MNTAVAPSLLMPNAGVSIDCKSDASWAESRDCCTPQMWPGANWHLAWPSDDEDEGGWCALRHRKIYDGRADAAHVQRGGTIVDNWNEACSALPSLVGEGGKEHERMTALKIRVRGATCRTLAYAAACALHWLCAWLASHRSSGKRGDDAADEKLTSSEARMCGRVGNIGRAK
jgi:hypothetical protein